MMVAWLKTRPIVIQVTVFNGRFVFVMVTMMDAMVYFLMDSFFLMKWLLYCHLIIDPAGMAVGAKKSKGSFAPGFKLESSGSDSEESVDEKKGN